MHSEEITRGVVQGIAAEKRRHWVPLIVRTKDDRSWIRYFRTCRPCPECRNDLSSNGRGAFRCPTCGYRERDGKPLRRRAS